MFGKVTAFLDPCSPEHERFRARLCEIGLPSVADRIAAMECDNNHLGVIALGLWAQKDRVRHEDRAALSDLVTELCHMARSPAWIPCPPQVIEQARAEHERFLAGLSKR